jgi:hypothetical protein
MSAGMMRNLAKEAIKRAKTSLQHRDRSSLLYACLELRFAIEYTCYQNLYAYIREVDDDAMKRWQPREVIATMISVDPDAEASSRISVGEEVHGQPPATMRPLGEDRRFTSRWANANHSALGNFLHAPTVHAIECGAEVTDDTIRRKTESIMQTLEEVLATPIFNVRFGQFLEFDCSCGRHIKRAEGSFKIEDGIVCPSCSATYDPIEDPDGRGTLYRFDMRGVPFTCSNCQREGFIGEHELMPGKGLGCDCGAQFRLRLVIARE